MRGCALGVMLVLSGAVGLCAAGLDPTQRRALIESISRVEAPRIQGRCVVFTASGAARHVGIAFEHEGYRPIYSFVRLSQESAQNLTERSVLFHIAPIPEGCSRLSYRLVIDGLWTTDPENSFESYDHRDGMSISYLDVPSHESYQTQHTAAGTRFVYQGAAGQTIHLAGTFNNWDPFMYSLEEVRPGHYELELPLPPGRWLYAFVKDGTSSFDTQSNARAYLVDGRVANVVVVP